MMASSRSRDRGYEQNQPGRKVLVIRRTLAAEDDCCVERPRGQAGESAGRIPLAPSRSRGRVLHMVWYFMHVNTRHHSLAIAQGPRNLMHHLMMEFYSLDDV